MVALDAEERAARRAAWIEVEREDELCVEMQLRIASEPEMPRQAPDPGLVDEDIPF